VIATSDTPVTTSVPRAKTQWRVVWEQFSAQPLAMASLYVLFALYVCAAFAPFIAPYNLNESYDLQGARYQPPTRVHFLEPSTGLPTLPFVYATTRRTNPDTFAPEYIEDTARRYPVRLFTTRAEPYLLLGFIPSRLHLFGVDEPARLYLIGGDGKGRDLYSRLLYGAQISLTIGLVAVSISFVIGTILGGLAGYYGGALDALVMRLTEVIQAIPAFFLLIALSALLPVTLEPQAYFYGVIVMLGLTSWLELAKAVRAQVLSLREQEFVAAARALGAQEARVITRHILPNTASYLVVLGSITIPGAMLAEAALSFVGRGIREPFSSWGLMLTDVMQGGIANMNLHPWALIPGAAIIVTIVAWNLLGDGLRAAFDPKKRR
jgi:peptide/nickel transport system permease protein